MTVIAGTLSPMLPNNQASSTLLEKFNALRIQKSKKGFSRLTSWPDLAPPSAVHLRVSRLNCPVVPFRMLRAAGIAPEQGLAAARHGEKVLIWGSPNGNVPRMTSRAHTDRHFLLKRTNFGPLVNDQKYAVVLGTGYVVVAPAKQALELARSAPIFEHALYDKLGSSIAPAIESDYGLTTDEIVSWNDFKLCKQNLRAKSGIAIVSTRMWLQSGFNAGDPIKFTRYKNATVIEKATDATKHSKLTGSPGSPRHYVGKFLFDTEDLTVVRVIAAANRLIVTHVDGELGKMCLHRPHLYSGTKQIVYEYPPVKEQAKLDFNGLTVLAWKEYLTVGGRLSVIGQVLNAAGFELGQPIRVRHLKDCLTIEPCSEAVMDTRVGESKGSLRIQTSLAHSKLNNALRVRVLVARKRLILTTTCSGVSTMFRHAPKWPQTEEQVRQLVAQSNRDCQLVAQPGTEVGEYNVPAGRRLQIQGKWLLKFGFKPGAKFRVVSNGEQVLLELATGDGASVTEHSPGSSKLYVPAQGLDKLKAPKVRVIGRDGLLQLLPLAA